MKTNQYPSITIDWCDKDGSPRYKIPEEYYNPLDRLILKYPIPEIIANTLKDLFSNHIYTEDVLENIGMDGLNRYVNQRIKDYIKEL